MIELRDVLMIVISAISTGVATWAAMRVDIAYLRVELAHLKEARGDHEERLRAIEHVMIEARVEK